MLSCYGDEQDIDDVIIAEDFSIIAAFVWLTKEHTLMLTASHLSQCLMLLPALKIELHNFLPGSCTCIELTPSWSTLARQRRLAWLAAQRAGSC